MSARSSLGLLAAGLALAIVGGCSRDLDPLSPAPFPSDAVVFDDNFGDGVGFQAFADSKLDAVQIDPLERYQGDAALRITVPVPTDPSGSFAGGAFVADVARDLTGYDALTFWARAAVPASLDVVGIGNDNTGTSQYTAETRGLALSTSWQKYVVPLPLPAVLDREQGLFFFAEGAEGGAANTIWFDEVQFENVASLGAPRPAVVDQELSLEVGGTAQVNATVTFAVGAEDVVMSTAPAYFTYRSSDEDVATVSATGRITVVGEGSATITASLGGVDATGAVTVNTASGPPAAAPTPTRDPADVISVFSDAYTSTPVDTWSADWDDADVEDVQIDGNDAKKYTNLVFAGIEMTSAPVDASSMTHFTMDIWTPDPTADPAAFKIKLVDFGADGAFAGGDDVEHEVTLTDATDPALLSNEWVSLEIPLSAFTGLTTRAAVAQIIISGDLNTVYVDNVYFYDETVALPTEPTVAAPTPTEDAANVISLFSGAYTDVAVDTWNTVWSSATYQEVQVAGDDAKKYSSLDFNGIETTATPIDASGMTNLRMDIWTPDATQFSIKLVDFGADGAFDGGDDTEHQIDFNSGTTPAIANSQWVSLDIPLDDFTGLGARAHLGQYIIVGQPTGNTTVWLDNVYFYNDASAPTEPTVAAPTPTEDAAKVISLFSGAYTDVAVDTWNTVWSSAAYQEVQVAGDDAKKYSSLDFNGIEATTSPIDATSMTHFHMDVWTPDATRFSIKLVDFGADGAFDGGDDTEHQIDFNSGTTPALSTGEWVSFDIPLSDFAGLGARAHLAQFIIVGQPTGATTVWIDNVYFHN